MSTLTPCCTSRGSEPSTVQPAASYQAVSAPNHELLGTDSHLVVSLMVSHGLTLVATLCQ